METTNFSRFHCSIERHLGRWGASATAVLVYSWALRISKNSGKFNVAPANAAEELGVSPRTAQRAYAELKKFGLFILFESGKAAFESSIYRVLSHKEWAALHPNQCGEKMTIPSSTDPLGKKLYAVTGGHVTFKAFQIANYQNTGRTEDEIVALFNEWYSTYKLDKVGKKWRKAAGYHFWQHLKTCASARESIGISV